MRTKFQFGLLAVLIMWVFIPVGCKRDKKDDPTPADTLLHVQLQFKVDQVPLQFNQKIFQNEAGNVYAVEKVQFYLSAFEFKRSDGSSVFSDEIIFVDAKAGTNILFALEKIPLGNYTSASFLIGLDSAHNKTDLLPATIDNVNMAWPESMGGGYHFLKFEGNYNDGGTSYGFAMHIGRNEFLVKAGVSKNMNLTDSGQPLVLTMNLNEWFKNPHIYDFNVDGNYSMGNMPAMMKLSQNGVDTFNE